MQRRSKKYAKPQLIDPYALSFRDLAAMLAFASTAMALMLAYAFF